MNGASSAVSSSLLPLSTSLKGAKSKGLEFGSSSDDPNSEFSLDV